MRFHASFEFPECGGGDHQHCPSVDMTNKGYDTCSCSCHEAIECAGWDEEKNRAVIKRNDILDDPEKTVVALNRALRELSEEKRIRALRVSDETRAVLGLDEIDAKRAEGGPF